MPTHDGMEEVVMRLLASSKPVPLAKPSLQPRDAEAVARMSARSFSLILAAGPTGLGKTTTLHSLLAVAGVQVPGEVTVKTSRGCDCCGGKGYKGRTGIDEILEHSPEIRPLIQRSARPTELYEAANVAGIHSLRNDVQIDKW